MTKIEKEEKLRRLMLAIDIEKEEKLRRLMLVIDEVIKALFALKRELGGLK